MPTLASLFTGKLAFITRNNEFGLPKNIGSLVFFSTWYKMFHSLDGQHAKNHFSLFYVYN